MWQSCTYWPSSPNPSTGSRQAADPFTTGNEPRGDHRAMPSVIGFLEEWVLGNGGVPVKQLVAGMLVGLVLGWLVGIGTGVAVAAMIAGSLYEYHFVSTDSAQNKLDMSNGCEPTVYRPGVENVPALMRCPRFHLP